MLENVYLHSNSENHDLDLDFYFTDRGLFNGFPAFWIQVAHFDLFLWDYMYCIVMLQR